MGIPPRDEDGRGKPHDDGDISDDAYVVRYISPQWLLQDEHHKGKRRLSKGAFAPSSSSRDQYQGMSVDILELMENDGISPSQRMRANFEAIVRLRVGSLRALKLQVGPDPKENNPYHGNVWGITSGKRKAVLRASEWIDKPKDVL